MGYFFDQKLAKEENAMLLVVTPQKGLHEQDAYRIGEQLIFRRVSCQSVVARMHKI